MSDQTKARLWNAAAIALGAYAGLVFGVLFTFPYEAQERLTGTQYFLFWLSGALSLTFASCIAAPIAHHLTHEEDEQ